MAPAGKPQSNKRVTTSPASWLLPSMPMATSMVWSLPALMATPSPSAASTTQTPSASQPALLLSHQGGVNSAATSMEKPKVTRAAAGSPSSDGTVVAIGAQKHDGMVGEATSQASTRLEWHCWNQRGSDIDGEADDDRDRRSPSRSQATAILLPLVPYRERWQRWTRIFASGHGTHLPMGWQCGSQLSMENHGDDQGAATTALSLFPVTATPLPSVPRAT